MLGFYFVGACFLAGGLLQAFLGSAVNFFASRARSRAELSFYCLIALAIPLTVAYLFAEDLFSTGSEETIALIVTFVLFGIGSLVTYLTYKPVAETYEIKFKRDEA